MPGRSGFREYFTMKIRYLLFLLLYFLPEITMADHKDTDTLLLRLARTTKTEEKLEILSDAALQALRTDLKAALSYSREIMLMLEEVKEPEIRQVYNSRVALILLYTDVYDKALELFLESLKISEEIQDQNYICVNNNNIGGVYLKLENYEKALPYFEEALKLSKSLVVDNKNFKVGQQAFMYNNVGLVMGKLGRKEEGITYIERAVEIADTLEPDMLGQYYANLTELYYLTGDREKAMFSREKSAFYLKKGNNLKGLADLDCLMASLLFNDGDYLTSSQLLDRSYEMAQKINSKRLLEKIYTLRLKFARKENNRDAIIENMEKLSQLKDDLVNESVLAKISSLKVRYEFDKQLVEQRNELEKVKLRHRMILAVAGMILVVLVMLFLMLRSRMKRIHMEKKMLEKDLEFRNREMTTTAMTLMKNADLIREIILRLMELKPNLKSENAPVVKEVIRKLQSLTQNDVWDEFEVRFNRVHVDFYRKLKEHCPDLTPTELKVCAFLRLNMSSKEISTLMGINSKSVDILRARIRKRLDMTNTNTNLITFLADF